MKIYTNEYGEIKAINNTEDTSLVEYEVDREMTFGGMSDFMILNYCYKKENEFSYSMYPAMDYNTLVMLDKEIVSKIIELQKENQLLREELVSITHSVSTLIEK